MTAGGVIIICVCFALCCVGLGTLLLAILHNEKRIDKLEEKMAKVQEDCPVCHGAGATTDHHDPCTECGGTGEVG